MSEIALTLTPDEQAWLNAYIKALDAQFSEMIEDIIVYGSRARGTATQDSDLDIIVIIREGDWKIKQAVASPGYLLATGTQVVPSLLVFTLREWEDHRLMEAPFWQIVIRDGVVVV